jgi:hypothetical protein
MSAIAAQQDARFNPSKRWFLLRKIASSDKSKPGGKQTDDIEAIRQRRAAALGNKLLQTACHLNIYIYISGEPLQIFSTSGGAAVDESKLD